MKRFLIVTITFFAMTSQAVDLCDPANAKNGKLPAHCRVLSSAPATGCKADAEKLCSGFGADGVTQCLHDHQTELSSTCKATMKPSAQAPKSK